ncbi:HAD-IB family hydrolase [Paenalcaligenes niemegkensis]|uniref:HAD family hydrolase n=1 Tax=Paenalcaligenes niemegkensis TaxID=2895469 RepID=UPI001EE7A5E0|nr:HAD family hydrolase [Paenalcaligenes niemegkensis]MCQ9615850.1 HAD-IB family hydrolase [Paenalcaligenes niemegkensis]
MNIPTNLALFDLDHTLLPLDSDYQWADFLARTGRTGDPIEARRLNEELMNRYNEGKLTAEESAQFMLGLLRKASSRQELAEWHAEFMKEIINPAIHPCALDLIKKHQQQGDLCAIVTATNEFVTTPVAKAFGIEHLIATIPEEIDGLYTGKIHGVPSFKEGKITRVDQWLHDLGLRREQFERVWFYSDSPNDLPLMEQVSDPIATNPSDSLRRTATERNWVILDIFADMMDAKS